MKTFFLILAVAVAVVSAAIPPEWQDKVNSFNAFFGEDDSSPIGVNGYPDIYLPLIGNGYVSHAKGVRSDTMHVSGIYNGETTSPSHRAAIPAVFAVSVDNSNPLGVLHDIQSGTYHRRGELADKSWYEQRWYAHRSLKHLYVMEMEVHLSPSATNTTLTLSSNSLRFATDFKVEPTVKVRDDAQLWCGQTTIPETKETSTHRVCVASTVVPKSLTVPLSDSGKTFTFVSAFHTALDAQGREAEEAVSEYTNAIALAAQGQLYPLHTKAWSDLWSSGIEISGRPDVSIAINASLSAILSSVRDDWAYGLAPGGLTNYYNGHSFWDTETWMYPPLLFLHPTISQSLLSYRFDRLDGARLKAQSYDPPFAGTMFPWESAFSGVETCPTFAATGLREDHISGDISYAVWQEWSIREDKTWLRQVGYPILVGVADFWTSISSYETSADGVQTAHINNVIPPDEYVDNVNDSVYTNFVAAQALRFAVQASDILGVNCSLCAGYSKLADDLVILFDDVLGIHPEYAGYKDSLVKQADVVLLHYPLGMPMSKEVQRADLEFYSARTDVHGPAMTWGMHSIGYLDLQDYSKAASFFNLSFQDNMHDPLQVWTETPDGNAGNFITGAGGFLQTVIFGYPGLRLSYGALSVTPQCVQGSSYLKIRNFSYLGTTMDLEYWCDGEEAPSKMRITSRGESGKAPLGIKGPLIKGSQPLLPLRPVDVTLQPRSKEPLTYVISKL